MNPLTQYLMIGKLIALLGAVAIICAQSSMIHRWHKQSDGNAAKAAVLQSKLDELASQSKQQQQSVEKVVTRYITVTKPEIQKQVERIRSAPLPGQCHTPREILDADI